MHDAHSELWTASPLHGTLDVMMATDGAVLKRKHSPAVVATTTVGPMEAMVDDPGEQAQHLEIRPKALGANCSGHNSQVRGLTVEVFRFVALLVEAELARAPCEREARLQRG
eukprot:4026440-Alexandrium_andersonii.AAC.1